MFELYFFNRLIRKFDSFHGAIDGAAMLMEGNFQFSITIIYRDNDTEHYFKIDCSKPRQNSEAWNRMFQKYGCVVAPYWYYEASSNNENHNDYFMDPLEFCELLM